MLSISFIIIAVTAITLVVLGFLALQNSKQKANGYFGIICLSLSGWVIVNFLADYNAEFSLIWTRLAFVMVELALIFFVLFANNFPLRAVKNRLFEPSVYVIGTAILGLAFTPFFIPSVALINDTSTVVTGPLYNVFLVFFPLYLLVGVSLLVWSSRHLGGTNAIRVNLVLTGASLMAALGSVTNLIMPLMHQYTFANYGGLSTLLFTGLSSYAIIKHRLFDIRLIVARSMMYGLMLVTLAGIYGGAMFGVTNIFFKDTNQGVAPSIAYTVMAIVLSFTFQPLRRFFEKATDRVFYRDRYDSQVVLNNFSGILVSELDLDRILKRTIADICGKLHIQFGQLVVFNHDRVYRIEHHGPLPKRLMIVPELRRLNRALIVADELPDGERKELLESHGIRVSLMLSTRDEFIGYLLLGDKLSGDIYSSQDLELLEIIGKQLAVAISNAKAYAEIQEFNQTLQDRVDHATSRLRVANRHLKELDKAKDEFISMASHQLRTPLTTIKGYLSMMLEGDAGHMSKTQTEFANYAFGSSERMVNLISDLLNVSRLSAGRFIIQTKPTDMVAMIRDEVRQLDNHATAKSLKLVFEPPAAPLPMAEIDDNKTRQVVMNFIDNAIYYTPTGGTVTVQLDQTGQYVRLRVIDTGIGVPEIAKKKLFSKFFRADNAQSVRPDGTGLGLYLARRVVEDQGGTILFSSTLGKGSTFGFELPLRPVADKKKEGIRGK